MAEGADVLDVGGVKAGPGPEVSEAEELERVVPAVEALAARFDVPLSVDTWRASVLAEAAEAGACVANDISGFADPDYLPVAARLGASVVATHIRLAPRVADPEPEYPGGLVPAVLAFLADRAAEAESGGHPGRAHHGRRGARPRQDRAAVTGAPAGLRPACCSWLPGPASPRRTSGSSARSSASRWGNGGWRRWPPTPSGITLGCRVLRVHDVRGARRTADLLAEVLAARAEAPEREAREREP